MSVTASQERVFDGPLTLEAPGFESFALWGESQAVALRVCWPTFRRHRFSVDGDTPRSAAPAFTDNPATAATRSAGMVTSGRPRRLPCLLARSDTLLDAPALEFREGG